MPDARIVLLDDDRLCLSRLTRVLVHEGYEVHGFETPGRFLDAPTPAPPCCLLLDLCMPEFSGLTVQRAVLSRTKVLPVIFMSGGRDAQASIDAMKSGALDFLLKPFPDAVLISAVERAVKVSIALEADRLSKLEARERLHSLTPRETEVCVLVADGMTSREIGTRLGVTESTIALHRTHIMSKLGAKSVVEVVRLVDLSMAAEREF